MTDRPISNKIKRQKTIRKTSIAIAMFVLIIFLGRLISGWTESTVNTSHLIIVKPEIRSIQTGFRATGIVRSSKTKTLIAPFKCSVEKININNGESVLSKAVIMELSTLELEKEVLQLNDEKLLMIQQKHQLQKDLAYHRNNNQLNQQHDSIQIHNLRTELEQLKQLYKIGGTPYESVNQAEMKLQMAQIENKQSKLQLAKQEQDKTFEVNQLEIKIRLHNQKIAEVQHLIEKAMLTVPFSGIIQKIYVSTGENVSEGAPLAIIASSENIEVVCETGSTYSDELYKGQRAVIKYGENSCEGTITQIDQTISNNNVRFLLTPDTDSKLKLNQSLQVQVITKLKDSVWSIPRRNYYTGPGMYKMYVVQNGEAFKQNVALGMGNFEYVEVVSGAIKNDEIIIDGIPEHIKSNSFKLKY